MEAGVLRKKCRRVRPSPSPPPRAPRSSFPSCFPLLHALLSALVGGWQEGERLLGESEVHMVQKLVGRLR